MRTQTAIENTLGLLEVSPYECVLFKSARIELTKNEIEKKCKMHEVRSYVNDSVYYSSFGH